MTKILFSIFIICILREKYLSSPQSPKGDSKLTQFSRAIRCHSLKGGLNIIKQGSLPVLLQSQMDLVPLCILPQFQFMLNLTKSLACAISGVASCSKMASSQSLQWEWIKENRIKDSANYTIALPKLFNKSAAQHLWYFENLCFKLFVKIHSHLAHIFQAIEAVATENVTPPWRLKSNINNKTHEDLFSRSRTGFFFTEKEFMYNAFMNVSIL